MNVPPRSARRPLLAKTLLLGSVAAMTVGGTARAEDRPIELGTITVTANRTERTLDETPEATSVVARQKIDERPAEETLDLLRDVPGVSIPRNGGIPAQINIRGFNNSNGQVPVFIDGDRIIGRPGVEFLLIDPSRIERIEVIRGSGSPLYGSGALGGLVNFITRPPEADMTHPFHWTRGELVTSFSSNGLGGGVSGFAEGAGEGFDARVTSYGRRVGDYSSGSGVVQNSSYTELGGEGQIGWRPTANQRIELRFGEAESWRGRIAGATISPGAPLITVREDPLRQSYLRLGYSGKFDGLIRRVESNIFLQDYYTAVTQHSLAALPRIVDVRNVVDGPLVFGGKTTADIAWAEHNLLTIGSDGYAQWLKGFDIYQTVTAGTKVTNSLQQNPDSAETDWGIFASNAWDPVKAFTLTTRGRFDWFHTSTDTSPVPSPSLSPAYAANREKDNTAPSGGIGAVWRPLEHVHVTGNVSSNFRMPTLSERFNSTCQGTTCSVPNPNLQPERGETYEAGLRFPFSNFTAGVTAFKSVYHNLIYSKPIIYNGVAATQFQNVESAETRGVEAEARWQATEEWRFSATLATLRGEDTSSHKPLPFIAPFRTRLSAHYAPAGEPWFAEVVSEVASAKTRIDTSQEYPTAAYAILDLYGGLELRKFFHDASLPNAQLTASVHNIFNVRYVDPTTAPNVSYPVSATNPLQEPGRSFYASLRIRF
jgi:hemoglobin/transferrin/lactoferrin receptor protein